MRVGVIGPHFPDSFADNILRALPDLGVEGVSLGPLGPTTRQRIIRRGTETLRRMSSEGERVAQALLLRRARDSECDVIISVEQALLPETVGALRSKNARVALWFPDAVSNVGRLSMIASDYDALFLKDPLFVQRLKDVYCLPVHYLPEACSTSWHRPIGTPGSQPYIAVVGNIYATRARLLTRLVDAGVPLKLYGGPFPRWYKPGVLGDMHVGRDVTCQEKARVFREARGVLNNLHPAEMASVNCRLFEAAGSGAAVLCEERPSLGELFETGVEVLSFGTFDELVDHCRTLLSDGDLTAKIGDAAHNRAYAEHTYQHRLRKLFEVLG